MSPNPAPPSSAPPSSAPPGPAAQPGPSTTRIPPARFALLFCVVLTTAAGNTAMQSVMPSIGTSLGVDDVWITLAFSWSALLWMLTAPYWARRSDRRGRKAMMQLGLIGFALSFAICGAILWIGLRGALSGAAALLLFAAARSLYGLLGSAAPPAVQAYVASRTDRAGRTRALTLIASSFALGTVIGPAVAPLLVLRPVGLVGPFIGFTAVALAVAALLRLRLPDDTPSFAARGGVTAAPFSTNSNHPIAIESALEEEGEPPAMAAADALGRAGAAPAPPARLSWRDRRLRPWVFAGLLGGHAQAALFGLIGFLVLDRLGLRGDPDAGAGPVGLVMLAGALATLLAQWGLIPLFRLGPRASTLFGMALGAAGTGVVAVAATLHTMAIGIGLAALGFGLFRPGFTAGASLAVGRREQGEVSGITTSVNGACYVFAPSLGVWLYGQHPAIGFIAIAGCCLAVLATGWRAMPADLAET